VERKELLMTPRTLKVSKLVGCASMVALGVAMVRLTHDASASTETDALGFAGLSLILGGLILSSVILRKKEVRRKLTNEELEEWEKNARKSGQLVDIPDHATLVTQSNDGVIWTHHIKQFPEKFTLIRRGRNPLPAAFKDKVSPEFEKEIKKLQDFRDKSAGQDTLIQ